MELLSYKQFSERFPLGCETSDQAWSLILKGWRESHKLQEIKHWRYRYLTTDRPIRVYDVVRVVKLLCMEARGEKPRPTVSYLYQTYLEEFVHLLEANQAERDASSKQAKETPA